MIAPDRLQFTVLEALDANGNAIQPAIEPAMNLISRYSVRVVSSETSASAASIARLTAVC